MLSLQVLSLVLWASACYAGSFSSQYVKSLTGNSFKKDVLGTSVSPDDSAARQSQLTMAIESARDGRSFLRAVVSVELMRTSLTHR